MSGCSGCGGCGNASGCAGCSGCGGCASTLELTRKEMDFLRLLGQVAFLPLARRAEDPAPICREDPAEDPAQVSLLLQCLEKKRLVSLDYDKPLHGAAMERYCDCPIHGSIALTRRGQQVLELLEVQGYQN